MKLFEPPIYKTDSDYSLIRLYYSNVNNKHFNLLKCKSKTFPTYIIRRAFRADISVRQPTGCNTMKLQYIVLVIYYITRNESDVHSNEVLKPLSRGDICHTAKMLVCYSLRTSIIRERLYRTSSQSSPSHTHKHK